MGQSTSVADTAAATSLTALAIALLNLPFGYWRAGLRRLSPAWFVAIHAPIPLALALRYAMGIPFRLSTLPLFVASYCAGQFVGSVLRGFRGRMDSR